MNVTFETVLNDIKSSAKKTEILPSILSVREELHRTYTIDPNSLHGDTDTFYKDYRWEHWLDDLSDLDYDNGIAFYPFLWAEAKNLESRKRSVVSMAELIGLEFEFLRQLG